MDSKDFIWGIEISKSGWDLLKIIHFYKPFYKRSERIKNNKVHCFANYFLENEIDLRFIQKITETFKIKIKELNIRLRKKYLDKIKSSLNKFKFLENEVINDKTCQR